MMAFSSFIFGKRYRNRKLASSTYPEKDSIPNASYESDGPDVWSEADHRRYPQWLNDILEYNKHHETKVHPSVAKLAGLIESHPRIKLLASGMCDEEEESPDPRKSSKPHVPTIQSYQDMLRILDYMLKVPPLWNTHMFMIGLEAAPFYMLLRHIMHNTCGFAFFQEPEVNAIMKEILDAWGKFLASPESASCLSNSEVGWLGPEALAHLVTEANQSDDFRSFEDLYICDSSKIHYGFTSWDNFFTRQFRDGIRPVADPYDDNIIANACEAQPWRIAHNVQYKDKFWLKGGRYSLREMLADDDLSWNFIGGTVYQAYLSALAYHRWHSPVNGTIVKTLMVPGFYFSEPCHKGFGGNDNDIDKTDPNWQQAWLSAVATRTVIFIQADNPLIGLVAVVLIGMSEVSTCELTVVEGQRIGKGEQLGMFHFGGSTHCVVFQHGVELTDLPQLESIGHNLPVRSKLARVMPRGGDVPVYAEKNE